jgi:hypothetical protein
VTGAVTIVWFRERVPRDRGQKSLRHVPAEPLGLEYETIRACWVSQSTAPSGYRSDASTGPHYTRNSSKP